MSLQISVVICTRNRPDTIGQAVETVAGCDFSGFDIHIMDQSTDTKTQEIVGALSERYASKCDIVYHHLAKAGLSAAYNAGIRTTTGDLIAFTDDDVTVPSDWLSQIKATFDADADAELLYGQVCIPESVIPELQNGNHIPVLVFEEAKRFVPTEPYEPFGMGANMAIRRRLIERVGGFDEAMGGGGTLRSSQDHDFAYRTHRFGGTIALAPKVKVDHYGIRSEDQWPGTLMAYGFGDGAFYGKHIRCGDKRLVLTFAKLLIKFRLREVQRRLGKTPFKPDLHGRNLMAGYRAGLAFDIDPKYRLYQESSRGGKMSVTEANAVTTATRK